MHQFKITKRTLEGHGSVPTMPRNVNFIVNPSEEFLQIVDKNDQDDSYQDEEMNRLLWNPNTPRPLRKLSNKIKMYQVMADNKYRNREFLYVYDYGDGWEHQITSTGRVEQASHFCCGRWRGSPMRRGRWRTHWLAETGSSISSE